MARFGIGRRPERQTVEDTPEVDITIMADRGAFDRPGREGEFAWASKRTPTFEFVYTGEKLHIVEPFEVHIPLVVEETPSGGQYFLAECPKCGGQCRKLYLEPVTYDGIACRECAGGGLVYKRSRYSGSPRRVGAYKVSKLRRELQAEEAAASAPGARYSEKRQSRIALLKAKLADEEKVQRQRMWNVVDELRAEFQKIGGFDPWPYKKHQHRNPFETPDEDLFEGG